MTRLDDLERWQRDKKLFVTPKLLPIAVTLQTPDLSQKRKQGPTYLADL